jgi:hypothetical protein
VQVERHSFFGLCQSLGQEGPARWSEDLVLAHGVGPRDVAIVGLAVDNAKRQQQNDRNLFHLVLRCLSSLFPLSTGIDLHAFSIKAILFILQQ